MAANQSNQHVEHTPPTEPDTRRRQAEVRHAARTEFDKWALSYDRSRLNELVFFPSVRVCQEEIERWLILRGRKPFRMLDVGCGTGTLINLVAAGAEAELVVGLDYSPVMVRHASEKIVAGPHTERLHAVVGDSERLPFPDQTFDIVTCCNSFHHYPHQAACIAGFRRVLRPGGVLILVDGFRDNVVGWIVFDVAVAMAEGDIHHASWSNVRDMINEAGFATLRQRKLNVLAPLLVSVAMR